MGTMIRAGRPGTKVGTLTALRHLREETR
jgi:hypothetical protein